MCRNKVWSRERPLLSAGAVTEEEREQRDFETLDDLRGRDALLSTCRNGEVLREFPPLNDDAAGTGDGNGLARREEFCVRPSLPE